MSTETETEIKTQKKKQTTTVQIFSKSMRSERFSFNKMTYIDTNLPKKSIYIH